MKHGVLCFLKLHNPHISRCSSTERWQSYETSKSNRRPPENEAVDARMTFHLSGKRGWGCRGIKIILRISMLEGKLSCLHKYSTFLNCFLYENKDEDWIGFFMLCFLLYEMKDFMTCQKECAASHSIFPTACACPSLRVWQIGFRGAVVLVSGWGFKGEGWEEWRGHSIRVITALPVSRDWLHCRTKGMEFL